MLENQRVLITGATGQVARPIAEKLNQGNEVWAAARFSDPLAKRALEAQGINTVFYELGESDLSMLPDVDYVIHCGCNLDPSSPDEGILQNAEGVGFLMHRYENASAFFYMSSSSIYALKDDPKTPVTEEDALGGYSSYSPHYAMSKQSAEAVVRFMARFLDLPTVIARLDVAYGQYSHGGAPMLLVDVMREGTPYHRSQKGDSYCCPIYQDDIVLQVQGLLEHASVPAITVNLCGDEVVSVEEMIDYLQNLTGLTAVIETKDSATWGMTVLDSNKRRALAGPCTVNWREGVYSALQARHPDLLTT